MGERKPGRLGQVGEDVPRCRAVLLLRVKVVFGALFLRSGAQAVCFSFCTFLPSGPLLIDTTPGEPLLPFVFMMNLSPIYTRYLPQSILHFRSGLFCACDLFLSVLHMTESF